jgi:hypothetical protein
MSDNTLDLIEDLQIEALSDEALETIAGGGSKGKKCCSGDYCSTTILPPGASQQ